MRCQSRGSPRRPLRAWALLALLLGGAAAAPAGDVFDEIVYLVATRYGGDSPLRAAELRREFLPRLQQACAARSECRSDEAAVRTVYRDLIAALGDPHSRYTPSLAGAEAALAGEDGGFGFGAYTRALDAGSPGSGGRVVLRTLPGSPAAYAGLRPGDTVLSANGVPLTGDAGLDAWLRVQSRPAAAVLEYRRPGEAAARSVRLNPAPLPAPRVSGERRGNVGLLWLPQFSPGSAQALHDELRRLGDVSGVVLDLRGNPGGLVSEFLMSAAAFGDVPAITQKSRLLGQVLGFDGRQITVDGRPAHGPGAELARPARYTGPLVVLVDGDSASGAEFLARTLQARPRTAVLGERTAGVGDTVVQFLRLSDGAGLLLTAAQVLQGGERVPAFVQPGVRLPLDPREFARTGRDPQVERALELLRGL